LYFWRNLEKQIRQNLPLIVVRLTNGGLACVIDSPLNERFKLIELFPCPFYSDLGGDEPVHLVHAESFNEASFNMANQKKEPTQKTPKSYEIPIPKRSDFLRNLKKAAKPSGPRRPNK